MKKQATTSKKAKSAKTVTKPATKAATKTVATHKLGTDRGETANRARVIDKNFKQSRDVREDRGVRQVKSSPKNRSK